MLTELIELGRKMKEEMKAIQSKIFQTHNYQQLNLKKTKTKTKQTTRRGTDLEKWTSHGRFSMGKGWGRMGGEGTGNKHNW